MLAIRDQIAVEQHAGQFSMPVNDLLDFGALFRGAPPRYVTPLPGPALPALNEYSPVNDLTQQIQLRPADPKGYELRASAYDALGWSWLAEQDRKRAQSLRATVEK